MTFAELNLLYPFVLAAHNAEEYLHFEDFARTYMRHLPAQLRTREVTRNAMALLTCSSFVWTIGACLSGAKPLIAISKTAMFALGANAAGHCVLSLGRKRWVSGSISALVLILPYTCAAISLLRREKSSFASLLKFGLAGTMMIGPASIFFSAAGLGLDCLQRRGQAR